jgi:hypothetical protein
MTKRTVIVIILGIIFVGAVVVGSMIPSQKPMTVRFIRFVKSPDGTTGHAEFEVLHDPNHITMCTAIYRSTDVGWRPALSGMKGFVDQLVARFQFPLAPV